MIRLALSVAALASISAAQTTERVSVDSSGGQANSPSMFSSGSDDGRFVVFDSSASNLVAGDTNAVSDVFLRDRLNGQTTRVSVASDGSQADGECSQSSSSADGRYVTFESSAHNLVPGPAPSYGQIFVRDRVTGVTTRVSNNTSGGPAFGPSAFPCISDNGRYVAFLSAADDLIPGATGWQVYVYDRQTSQMLLASADSAGVPGDNTSSGSMPRFSADGRLVVFQSTSSNLVPGDVNPASDIFVHDLQTGQTSLVSVNSSGQQANGTCINTTISKDGRYVAFASNATNLVPGDTNGFFDAFVRDRVAGRTTRVSVSSVGFEGDGDSYHPTISADGRFVAFESWASNLVPGDANFLIDVFVHDCLTGQTTRESVSSAGAQGSDASYVRSISADGRFVTMASDAPNLVAGDTNGSRDIFLRDRGAPAIFVSCFGDGTAAACPCANSGSAGRGCENSASTGGAELTANGTSSLAADSLSLTSSGALPSALSIFLQGTTFISPVAFGDGLRCAGGSLKRLYSHNASAGIVSAPQGADASVSARSSALGDAIQVGSTRHYQTYYRDPNLTFCPSPLGDAWNVSNSVSAVWSP
jgi:Tol biopolymer transport system component